MNDLKSNAFERVVLFLIAAIIVIVLLIGTSRKTECIEGVEYIVGHREFSVKYKPDGKVSLCK